MNKEEFLRELKSYLSSLEEKDMNEIIQYYDEFISDAIESGKDEKDFISNLGSIENIAKKIKVEKIVKELNEKPTMKNRLSAIYSILGIITSPVWFPLAIVFVLVIFVLILSGFIVVLSMGMLVIGLVFELVKSFSLIFTSTFNMCIPFIISSTIIFLIGLIMVSYNFLYNTITLGFINFMKKIVLRKGSK